MTNRLIAIASRMAAILILGAVQAAPAASAAQQTVQAPNASPLQARIETPVFDLTSGSVEVPGYAMHTVPGAPRLPLYGLTFELPASGDWDLNFESTGSRVLPDRIDVAAVPVPNLDLAGPIAPEKMAALPSSVPVIDLPDPAIYSVDAFYPAAPVVAGEVVIQGGKRVLPVRVFPFQYNPVTRQLRYHPDLMVRVDVAGGDGNQAAAAPQPQGFYSPLSRLPGEGVFRIHTREEGLYRLTYTELAAAGMPVGAGGADPNTFAVYYKGQQVHIDVTGADDGAFDPGDLVIFYAVPYDGGRYQNYNIYQFTYGGGVAGQRMAVRSVTAPAEAPPASIITQTLHIEVDKVYFTNLARPSHVDHFFDDSIYPNSTTPSVTRTYNDLAVSFPVTTTGTVRINALFMGAFNLNASPDQSVLLRLNNRDVSLHQWDGVAEHLVTASAPAAWLDGAPNRLDLVGALSQLPGVAYYAIYPDWVDMAYTAWAKAASDRLIMRSLAAPASETAAAGFSSPLVSVIDVRDPSKPQRVSGFGAEADGASYKVYWDEDVANPAYALSTDGALRAPGAIVRDTPSDWANTANGFTYVAIIGAERAYNGATTLGDQLAAALQPLAAHRTADGFSVAQVKVQDIYDEWSYGRIDPMAIRSFLSYAYHNWATPPQYVLLVGDGHYDYNKVTSQTLPNLLPPYLADVDPWWGEVPTDNLYVSVDGLTDYLPDMAVGRLPVNTVADLNAVVNKIIAYESAAVNPADLWQQHTVYVADDCDDSAGDFHMLSDEARLELLPTGYTSQKIYYDNPVSAEVCPDGTHNNPTQARAAVRQAFSDGSFYLQWFGHGSQSRWGNAATMIAVNDFFQSFVGPTTQLPLSTANACLTGYFIWNSTFASKQSLAELMVITPQRGSIVDLSPSGLHIGSALLTLQEGIHEKLFVDRVARAGDVIDAAKWYFFENSFAYHDVIDTMVLFGDPATRLQYATSDLSTSTLQVDQGVAELGATLNYTLTLNNSSAFAASGLKAMVDYPQDLVTVADAGGAVNNGDTLVWSLPDVPAGGQLVRTFALSVVAAPAPENFDLIVPAVISSPLGPDSVPVAPTVALQTLTQILTAPDAVLSTLDASHAWAPPGFPITATMTISHADGLPAPGVQVTMTLPASLGAPTWLYASNSSLVYDPQAHRVTWTGDAPAGGPTTLAWSSVISPTLAACGDLLVDAAVDYNGIVTPQSATISPAVPDVDCSGSVTVADIQQVSARWGAPAGDPLYHPRYDLNADAVLDVLDITIAAQAWN